MSTEKEINRAISQNIVRYLAKNNMSQADLATAIGVSEATVSNWCKGIKMPRMQKFDAICTVLGCSRLDLFNQEQPPAPSASPSPEEEQLLKNFNELNRIGREKVLEDVESMTYNPKYKRGESQREA